MAKHVQKKLQTLIGQDKWYDKKIYEWIWADANAWSIESDLKKMLKIKRRSGIQYKRFASFIVENLNLDIKI